MRGSSLRALNAASARFAPELRGAGDRAWELGLQLLEFGDLLDRTSGLRRALTDPSRDAADKDRLLQAILGGKADPRVVTAISGLASNRWSLERDLAKAVETLGFEAAFASAQASGAMQRVENELFRIDRLLVGQRSLRTALGDQRMPADARANLIGSLIADQVHPITLDLVRWVVAHPHGRTFSASLSMLGEVAATLRDRQLAEVTTSRALAPAQIEKLGDAIERLVGISIQLNVTVDPDVIGGLRVQIGDRVIDATMLSRLNSAKRELAS